MTPSVLTAFWLVLLPWLNPVTSGPSPAVVPLLFSWGCAALLIAMCNALSGQYRKDALVRAVALAWLVAALISSCIGLLQYFGATAALGPWVNSSAMGEAYANLRQRNQFATLTNIGLAALLWCQGRCAIVLVAGGVGQRNLQSWIAPWLALLLAWGNAASSSRTGLLQLVLLFVLVWYWSREVDPGQRSAARRLMVLAVLTYVLAAFSLPRLAGLDPNASGIFARLQGGDQACFSRLTLWANVLHLIAIEPWLGWGWGNLDYAHFITLYPGRRFCDILDNAHNLPLHLAVELGVPVALLVCGVGLWLAWRGRPWRAAGPDPQLAWSVMAVILLHSLLEYPLWYGPFQMAFALALWILWRSHGDGCVPPSRFVPFAHRVWVFVAMVGIAFCLYAGWDYHRISQIYMLPGQRDEAYRDNTLEKLRASWLFKDQVRFAELSVAVLTPANAAYLHPLAKDLLRFSPEARVVEKVIESATMLGRDDEAVFYLARYRSAFPDQYSRWVARNKGAGAD